MPLEYFTAIFCILNYIKSREFWEVLEQISMLYANGDRYSNIPVAFRKLHSEKTALEALDWMVALEKIVLNFHIFCARKC